MADIKVTARQLIRDVLRDINVIMYVEDVSQEDYEICFKKLNQIVDSSNNELDMFSYRREINIPLTGASVYNISDRPVQGIQSILYQRNSNTGYHEVDMVSSEEFRKRFNETESYQNDIKFVYYNGTWPVSQLKVYPNANTGNLILTVSGVFELFESLDSEIWLPSGFNRYLESALAVMIAGNFGVSQDQIQILMGKAVSDKSLIKDSNKRQIDKSIDCDFKTWGLN